jgi:hypothetical protein
LVSLTTFAASACHVVAASNRGTPRASFAQSAATTRAAYRDAAVTFDFCVATRAAEADYAFAAVTASRGAVVPPNTCVPTSTAVPTGGFFLHGHELLETYAVALASDMGSWHVTHMVIVRAHQEEVMTDQSANVYGVSVEEWQAAYKLGIQEFSALRVVIKRESDLIRIAFGNNGPPLNEQGLNGCPVYTHAVMMTPGLALTLSKLLRDLIASPAPKP